MNVYHIKKQDKNAVIIIEEDLILSPDFLYFFTQVYKAFTNDLRVGAVNFMRFLNI